VPRALKLFLDDYDLDDVTGLIGGNDDRAFAYVVTPNADHIIRFYDEARFREFYSLADYVLLDSRFLARILFVTRGMRPRVCPGSDLTERLFSIIKPDDRIVLIGATEQQARSLVQNYHLNHLEHYNPPMGFARDPKEIERTLEFVESRSPFRYCFLAVGSPQQELLAYELKRRARARGVGLCIGASINFLSGEEKRAPRWMQQLSLEWLYRLLQNPGRMGRRYFVRGPRVFRLLPKIDIELRRVTGAGAGK
jgi:exopolysaccharide biosynthesis WecB/TagA/CpsF family protein